MASARIGNLPVFLGVAIAAVALTFVVFWAIERALYTGASTTQVAVLYFARGVTIAVVALVVATLAVKHSTDAIAAAERQWFHFLDGLPVACFALNAQGHPHYANQAALDLLGAGVIPDVDPDELSIVYPSFIQGTDTPYPPKEMPIVRALGGEEAIAVDDVELERDGRRIPIEVLAGPIRGPDGDVAYSIAVFFDVTERRRAQRDREAALAHEEAGKAKERQQRLQSDFINHAAHQLYTPLTPLRLQLSLLEHEHGSERISSLIRNVDRLQALVGQILEVAQFGEGGSVPSRERIDLKMVVRRASDRVAKHAYAKGVTLREHVSPFELDVDGNMLGRALGHLLDNAVKFAPAGGNVVIRAGVQGDEVSISVTGDGGGWDGPAPAEMFDAFYQGPSNLDLSPGWGLGLFVARLAADAHGGRLNAHSDGAGKGATFTITIPLTAVTADAL